MTRTNCLVSLFLLLMMILVSSPSFAATVNRGDNVVLMGDSEAYLLSWEFPKLARAGGVRFASVVSPGSSVISWARGLDESWLRLKNARPDVLLVSLGANDACSGPRVVRNEGPFMRSFQGKLAGIKARCVVWLGPPAIGAPNPTRVQCSRALASPGLDLFFRMVTGEGLAYLDARDISIQLWDDYLHCSRPRHQGDRSNGCETWATWVWRRITTEDLCEEKHE